VAEDLAFADLIRKSGGRTTLWIEPGALKVRMYPEGFGAFIKGWRRNFREGIHSAGSFGFSEIFVSIVALLGPPIWMSGSILQGRVGDAAVFLGCYAVGAFTVGWHQRQVGDFRWISALSFPLFSAVFVFVSLLALVDRLVGAPVSWRGRSTAVSVRAGMGDSPQARAGPSGSS